MYRIIIVFTDTMAAQTNVQKLSHTSSESASLETQKLKRFYYSRHPEEKKKKTLPPPLKKKVSFSKLHTFIVFNSLLLFIFKNVLAKPDF